MKKLFYLCIVMLSLGTIINSCRDNSEIDVNQGFTFKVERDVDFVEKALREVNNIKFNVITDYDFSKVPHFFKFTTNGQGSLSLNGERLEPNKEYSLKTYNNNFEYIGNEQGVHTLKIIVRNDRGHSKTEEFSLSYGISDFTISVVEPANQIYQGQKADYILRVRGARKTGKPYYIRFDRYEGEEITLNGDVVQKGQFYPIQERDLDNIRLSLKSNRAGRNVLSYTLKNETVSRERNEVVQEILPRKINIFNIEVEKSVLDIGDQLKIVGVISKIPNEGNKAISYRTWVSKGLNGGISSTNGNWVDNYQLGNSNNFSGVWEAKLSGKYEYNIQFKDEYGNESEIRTFDITINEPLKFVGEVKGLVTYTETHNGDFDYIKSINLIFNAKGSKTKKIVKYEAIFNIKYTTPAVNGYFSEKKEEVVKIGETYNIPQEEININKTIEKGIRFDDFEATYTLKVTDSEGNIITKTDKALEVRV